MKKINLFLVLQKHPGIKTKANMNIFFLLLLVFKGATSRILHLEKAGKIFQVGYPKSILISLIRNHPCLGLVYYYFFGVSLP